MQETAEVLLAIGGMMLLGMMTDMLGRKTFLPRVTLLLLFGMLIGPNLLNLLPENITSNFDLIANTALIMVGFLVGGHLKIGRQLFSVSLGAVIGTVIVVTICLTLVGVPLEVAIMLGCIATATDPAVTMDVIEETESKGPCKPL